jgi:hypothetical protein
LGEKGAARSASLIQLSKNRFSAPGGEFRSDRNADFRLKTGRKTKKPGVERRVNLPHAVADSREARLLSILYS